MNLGFATAEGHPFGRYTFYRTTKGSPMLDLDKMRKASAHKEREMELPLLGETVRVRLFKKHDIDAMRAEAMVAGEVNNDKFERLLFMRGLIEPAVDDATYEEIKNGNAAVYYSMLNAVMEGNGLTALAQRDARRTFPA